jgi:alkylation response protein AidB-like acyl-CoA dehydrogenase
VKTNEPPGLHTPLGLGSSERHRELEAPALSTWPTPAQSALRSITEELWATSSDVEAGPAVLASHLDALAAAGFYGIFAPPAEGGLGLGYADACAAVEELASGCVASTFLWAQHLRLLNAMLSPEAPAIWRQRLRSDVIAGRCKGGVVLTGLMLGPARLSAEKVSGGWRVDGQAPWVSGWGVVDKLYVVARGPGQSTVSLLLEAQEQPGLMASGLRLSALDATSTVRLSFAGLFVEDERLLAQAPYDASQASQGLRLNGSFALGLAKRCCLLLGPTPLDAELSERREQLDAASVSEMPAARAAACELATRAAHALAVTRGSRSALAGDVAERLGREAAVLLVFGSRPAIRSELLRRFAGADIA